jgi:tetratricopeptide (TPR) repeat protein
VAIRRKLFAAAQASTNSSSSSASDLYLTERFGPSALHHTLSLLGYVHYNQGEYDKAEAAYREALAIARKVRGDEHEDVATQLSGLGLTLWQKDELAKAEEALKEALAIDRKAYGTNAHPYVGAAINNLALVLKNRGKPQDAEPLFLEALEMTRKMAGAEPLARESLAIYETRTPDSWRAFDGRCILGATLLAQKKYADAEPLLLAGYEGMKQREQQAPKAIRTELKFPLQDQVRLYEETGRQDRVVEWKQKLAEWEKAGKP